VDGILEDIRLHMEVNDPTYNQHRMSVAKYLAELYNYRLVDSNVIFKVLYSFLSFGSGPSPDDHNIFDPPDHMLRIRLMCVLLDTCGIYFNAGSSKKKLDYFFAYFQRYYWRKREHPIWAELENAFPVVIINVVSETLPALRPKLKLCASLDEANEAVDKIEKDVLASISEKAPDLAKTLRGTSGKMQANQQQHGLDTIDEEGDEAVAFGGVGSRSKSAMTNESEDDSNSRSRSQSQQENDDFDDDDDDDDEEDEDDDEDSDDDEDGSDEEDEDEDEDDDDDDFSDRDENIVEIEEGMEDLHVPSAPKHVECEEDDEFVSLFDKMLNDNITESRTAVVPRAQQMEIVAPMHSKTKKNYGTLIYLLYNIYLGYGHKEDMGKSVVRARIFSLKHKSRKSGVSLFLGER
jgi:regulator of nonsense transcripts 2